MKAGHEPGWPFRIINIREAMGESMGLHRDDRYKGRKVMQDADQIVAECEDLITEHGLDVLEARIVVVNAMLGDQPLPLKDSSRFCGFEGLSSVSINRSS